MNIIIPARLGSKGLPFKNRTLFKATSDTIPDSLRNRVLVTTDDPEIMKMATDYGFGSIARPAELADDLANIRDVMFHAVKEARLPMSSEVIMLYLTYPERTWQDIFAAYEYYCQFADLGIADSLLCKKEIKTSPYLMLQELGADSAFGRQLISHDFYRRQDYPKCFEISHYVCVFRVSALYRLNKNMYGPATVFYPIADPVDVDAQKDLDQVQWKK